LGGILDLVLEFLLKLQFKLLQHGVGIVLMLRFVLVLRLLELVHGLLELE
jgi:hypothetical protein